ncbi:MAG TPA: phosphoribosyltransferase family protein [Steroidobacteraceae bacterium]|nr:phosphoribosyltransferase family protein [Steroidobacteraceae bacterium]
MSERHFVSRAAAGAALARELSRRSFSRPVTVLGLARGGIPVAYEVARELDAPLDVMLVRKVGMPGQPELAIGAIASGNVVVREPHITRQMPSLFHMFSQLATAERPELERRERVYRPGLGPLDLRGGTAILVDDGIATGSTMLAAIRAARRAGAGEVIAAAPVASQEAIDLIGAEADATVVLCVPALLSSIGEWYRDFDQVQDEEVCSLLSLGRAGSRRPGAAVHSAP